MAQAEYDFIVAGGGTAGLCLAGRLAENPEVSVLVIEAGKDNPLDVEEIATPGLAFNLVESEYDWAYETTMVDRPDYRRTEKRNTRGKVLGGSSSLNYFSWMRGSRGTYDAWARFGGEEWSFDNCFRYLRKSASFHDDKGFFDDEKPPAGSSEPQDSPLQVSPERQMPLTDALREGWKSRGYATTSDIFSGSVEGLCHVVRTVYNGVRCASTCFLEGKPNITVQTERMVSRVIIQNNTAVDIEVQGSDGPETYRSRHEVIVCCGVFETPKLLMLSGIGPQKELDSHNMDCLVHSPHVGRNLQDHPIVPHVFHVKDGYGLDHVVRPSPEQFKALTEYRKNRQGPLSCGLLETSAFKRLDGRLSTCKEWRERKEELGYDPLGPDGQPHFEFDFLVRDESLGSVPSDFNVALYFHADSLSKPVFAKPFQPHIPPPSTGHYLTVIVSLLRPLSRGVVSLRSDSALDPPRINLNFLSDQLDVVALREGVCFIDEVILRGSGIKDVVLDEYPIPIPRDSDEGMHGFIRGRVSTGYHPCGSCRMGKTIEEGAVDSRLNVFGVSRLRIADASVFPVIPDGRIQNAVYMVAEKCADMIKQDYLSLYPKPLRVEKGVAAVQQKLNSFFGSLREIAAENRRVFRDAFA